MYSHWRSSYQEGGWATQYRVYPRHILFLSQARTWICNVICRYPYFMFSELRWEVIAWFIDIVGIDDHHCLNFLFIFSHFTLTVIIIRNYISTNDNIYTLYPSFNMLPYFDRFLLQMTIFKHNSARIKIFWHYTTISYDFCNNIIIFFT